MVATQISAGDVPSVLVVAVAVPLGPGCFVSIELGSSEQPFAAPPRHAKHMAHTTRAIAPPMDVPLRMSEAYRSVT